MSDNTNTLTTIAPAVGWAIILVGWTLAAKDANNREQRKEIRAHLTSLIADVHAIEERGHEYYSTDGSDPNARTLGMRIKLDLSNLAKNLERLRKSKIGGEDSKRAHIAFRQKLTGGNFDSAFREKASVDDEFRKKLEISSAATDLIDMLERDFFEKYNAYVEKLWAFWRR
jgi:hypothetical protein